MTDESLSDYYDMNCPSCGRERVQRGGVDDRVCEKCDWDLDASDWASITRAQARHNAAHPPGCSCIECHFEKRNQHD
jgi:ribosomal protein L37AE/L43A